jgi:DNA-directed RNA polymerase subunit H (RpoH/RPB5)
MGRTSNTEQRISKDRAHVHFELNLFVNDHFAAWFAQRCPGQRNDHGAWNGRNLAGLDPREVLLAEHQLGPRFSLLNYLRSQTVLCRVQVRHTKFPWVQRYAPLIRRNPLAEKEGIAGYELVMNYTGVIFELTPRAPSEMRGNGKAGLLSVNEAEAAKNRCGHLVAKRAGAWQLTPKAVQWLDLVTY